MGLSIITNSPSLELKISSAALLGIGSAMYLPCVPAIIADKIASDSMVKVYSIRSVLVNAIYGFSSLIGWMPELLVSSMGLGMSDAYRLSIICLIPIGFGALIPILCVSKPSNTRRPPLQRYKGAGPQIHVHSDDDRIWRRALDSIALILYER